MSTSKAHLPLQLTITSGDLPFCSNVMKALYLDELGPPEALKLGELPDLDPPGDGEVLVDIYAAVRMTCCGCVVCRQSLH